MYNKDFYPTPGNIVKRMWDYAGKCILEPSAGKGDLADGYQCLYRQRPNIDVIEIEPELQVALKGKGYNLVGDDFLNFWPKKLYDTIIMNPPFSNGVDHVLHAWEILDNGKIICLLNTETLNNAFSSKRQLLKNIIAGHRFNKRDDLGQCFIDAERKTSVNVTMLVLYKNSQRNSFGYFDDTAVDLGEVDFNVASSDSQAISCEDNIDTMVRLYEQSIEAYKELLKAKNKVLFYSKQLSKMKEEDLLQRESSDNDRYNGFMSKMNSDCWDYIFEKTEVSRFATKGVKREFDKLIETQRQVDFNRENIENIMLSLGMSAGNIMKESMIEVFDRLTRYDEKNKVHVEGWKTNDSWRINKKVIIPGIVEYGWNRFSLTYCYNSDFLPDIDRVMCTLSGKNYNDVYKIADALYDAIAKQETECESEFFKLRYYKKGTLHLTFKSKQLLDDFNLSVAKGKNWIGDG